MGGNLYTECSPPWLYRLQLPLTAGLTGWKLKLRKPVLLNEAINLKIYIRQW
jgi:hypothetical protein